MIASPSTSPSEPDRKLLPILFEKVYSYLLLTDLDSLMFMVPSPRLLLYSGFWISTLASYPSIMFWGWYSDIKS